MCVLRDSVCVCARAHAVGQTLTAHTQSDESGGMRAQKHIWHFMCVCVCLFACVSQHAVCVCVCVCAYIGCQADISMSS